MQSVSLRATAQSVALEIDDAAGVIRGAAVLTMGTARPEFGEPFEVTMETLQAALAALGNDTPVNLSHRHATAINGAGIIDRIGFLSNARIEGDTLRADVTLLRGPNRDWALDLAKNTPARVGLSIIGSFSFAEANGLKVGRVERIESVDLVDSPGGNPNGLLSGPNQGESDMDELKAILEKMGKTPEQIADICAKVEGPAETPKPEMPAQTAAPAAVPTPVPTQTSAPVDPTMVALSERKRISEIRSLSGSFGLGDAWADQQINAGTSIEAVRLAALTQATISDRALGGLRANVGQDRNLVSLRPAVTDAIRLRGNMMARDEKPHERANEFRGRSMVDTARRFLALAGVPGVESMPVHEVVHLMSGRAVMQKYPQIALQATGDFDGILYDAQNKTLAALYAEQTPKWPTFCRKGTAADFKTIYTAILAEVASMEATPAGGPIRYKNLSDGKESCTLARYTNGAILTYQAMVNDDLDAFSRLPRLQADAARRAEDTAAFGVLTTNANMDTDSLALFYARTTTGSTNVISSSGTTPTFAELAKLEALIMNAKGRNGSAYYDAPIKTILVPTAIYRQTQQLVNSSADPAKYNDASNPYYGQGINVVGSAQLSANDSYFWYVCADPNVYDVLAMYFLADAPAPVLKQETDFDTEDRKFAVSHCLVCKAIDWRFIARDKGQT